MVKRRLLLSSVQVLSSTSSFCPLSLRFPFCAGAHPALLLSFPPSQPFEPPVLLLCPLLLSTAPPGPCLQPPCSFASTLPGQACASTHLPARASVRKFDTVRSAVLSSKFRINHAAARENRTRLDPDAFCFHVRLQ